jgi:hypothetical protein
VSGSFYSTPAGVLNQMKSLVKPVVYLLLVGCAAIISMLALAGSIWWALAR